MLKRLDEVLIPLAALIFSIVYIKSTMGMAAESTIFPRTIMTVLCLLGAGVAIAELRGSHPAGSDPDGKSSAPLVFVMSLAYVLGFWLIGFVFAAPVFLAVTMILLGQPKLRSVLVAILLPAAIYLLFSMIFNVAL